VLSVPVRVVAPVEEVKRRSSPRKVQKKKLRTTDDCAKDYLGKRGYAG
jgi:hypothetical protein